MRLHCHASLWPPLWRDIVQNFGSSPKPCANLEFMVALHCRAPLSSKMSPEVQPENYTEISTYTLRSLLRTTTHEQLQAVQSNRAILRL